MISDKCHLYLRVQRECKRQRKVLFDMFLSYMKTFRDEGQKVSCYQLWPRLDEEVTSHREA